MLTDNIKNKILEGKPFYVEDAVSNIFSWKELESLINLSPFLNDLRFHILNDKKYEWGRHWWKTDNSAYPTSIVKEEIKHHVCYIQDASRASKNINTIASELETLTGLPTDAHIFFSLTTKENEGLGIHNDISNNFIVQIEGETNFKVWDIIAEEGIHNIKTIDKKPMIEVILKKGDVIYIPKKYWHHAISVTKRLSVSFPMSYTEENIFESREWINLNDTI
jgi:hypothetical protein